MRGGFCSGVHAVLWHFVQAARGRLNALAVEVIERQSALANRVGLLNGFCHVCLGERGGFNQRTPRGQLRGERRGKRATGSVQVFFVHALAAGRSGCCSRPTTASSS